MKKEILFVIDSLHCAGAEKSLVTLMGLLDYSKYNVDLILFGHGGELESLVPKEVNILPPFRYTQFANKKLTNGLVEAFTESNYQMLYARLKYTAKIRIKKYRNAQKARLYWDSVSKVIEQNNKIYDVAISYAQGIPTFYVADKVKAKKKFGWVNVSYRLDKREKSFQKKSYDKLNNIVAVSESAKKVLLESFPEYRERIKVIYDINNPQFIFGMAEIGDKYEDNFDGLRIVTVGRLANQKGYDIALEACKILKEKGINFRWYVIGNGPLEYEIKAYIKQNSLTEHFKLLGMKANPYPFIKNADIYVQTSKFEGFGLAIAEARILNIPVVTTRFDAVYNQMIHGKNGLVVDMNAAAVSDAVLKLVSDKKLRENIVCYLENDKKGNIEEIEKFYQLIG